MNYEQFIHPSKSIFLVDMTKEIDHYFSELTIGGIHKYLKLGKKIWIIVNKKGYSNGIICYECGHIPQCKKCSVSISYHKQANGEMLWLCHICKTQYLMPQICEKCWSKKIKPYWIWAQQVAEKLQQEFSIKPIIIESDTVNSTVKVKKLFSQLSDPADKKSWKSSIIVWTQLLCQPIKDHPLDLLIFLNADIGLNMPDYTANERNFQILYEAFTKHSDTQFIVQTMKSDQFSIRFACKMDKDWFYAAEWAFRKEYNYPPFGELCVILYKNEIESRLFKKVDTLHQELLYLKQKYQMDNLEIYSTPPLIYKMFGKYRYHIILKWDNLRNFMDIVYTKLDLYAKWFKIDWMASSIV